MKKILIVMAAVLLVTVSCSEKRKKLEQEGMNAAEAVADSVTDSVAPEVQNTIREFYDRFVLGEEQLTDEAASQYCTPRMVEQLKAEYSNEYNDEGYAVWIFRTGRQDGPERNSQVNDISAKGDDSYEVAYSDMGWRATSVVRIAYVDGSPKIDGVRLLNVQE